MDLIFIYDNSHRQGLWRNTPQVGQQVNLRYEHATGSQFHMQFFETLSVGSEPGTDHS